MTTGTDVESFIARVPKCELHLHIEGTLEGELGFELARRNGIALPYVGAAQMKRESPFHDLASFLVGYYRTCRCWSPNRISTAWQPPTSPRQPPRTCVTPRSSSTPRRTRRGA